MRLFGKKANPQSEIIDVPPELRPYYREQAVAAHAHRTALRFLMIFIVLIIVAGGGIWSWLHYKGKIENVFGHHTTSPASPITSNQPSQSASQGSNTTPSTNNSPTPIPSPTPPSTSGSSTAPNPVANNTQPAQTQPTPSASQSGSTTTTTQPTTTQAIPNTGPGTTILLAALGIALAAMIVHYVHQRRSARS